MFVWTMNDVIGLGLLALVIACWLLMLLLIAMRAALARAKRLIRRIRFNLWINNHV